MSEDEGNTLCFVPRSEFKIYHGQLMDNIEENKGMIDKLNLVLYGNSKDGLIMMVQKLLWRNQYVDKGVSLLIGVGSSALTFFLIKWLGG